MRSRLVLLLALPAAALAALSTVGRSDGETTPEEEARLRCASRLSLSMTGRSASTELLTSPDPQARVDALLADDAFVEQFARFINSKLNDDPGEMPAADATYFLARHVLVNNLPWRELFDGKFRVETIPAADGNPAMTRVVADPNGLGYFRSRAWMIRYAGNEPAGYRLNSAFRIQQNIIGLDVGAVTSAPEVDISATGRMAAACKGCHYDSYFALDKVAKVLSRRQGPDDAITFVPPDEGPQTILGGKTIANDAELVTALVESTDHKFQTCRLAFEFLYGRPEATCEALLFDKCIDAYTATGDIRAAVKSIAQDPGYCE
ncbi:MAG: hypothetical protein M3619_30955 [Myxococcota bacterium]|nr:hypothetical protein [Myxococcota bacterium]